MYPLSKGVLEAFWSAEAHTTPVLIISVTNHIVNMNMTLLKDNIFIDGDDPFYGLVTIVGETEEAELQATLMIPCGESTNYNNMHMAYVTNIHISKTSRSKWIVMLYIIHYLTQVLFA